MVTFVSFVSFFGALIGLVSVIYPLRFFYIRDRKTALTVLAAAFVTCVVSAAIDGKERQQLLTQQQASVAAPRKSASELADEQCNVSGAVPNCKEVLTKMIVEQDARPTSRESLSVPKEQPPSRAELERRRDAALRQCWANANTAAARSGFKITPEVAANPGLVNADFRNMYLNQSEIIEEKVCEAGARMDNGGYSTFFHVRMYKGADGEMHRLD